MDEKEREEIFNALEEARQAEKKAMKNTEQLIKEINEKKMKQISLGTRMKINYEFPYSVRLPNRLPIILRLDGRTFHTLTKNMKKPFDKDFINKMQETAKYLCKNIDGAQFAYIQSDEISILIHNYKRLESNAWFDNKIQKIVSVSAGMASAYFSKLLSKIAVFDARIFVLPENEVCNYFIWRQQDWLRNSIQMQSRSLFSHKECLNKNTKELKLMCLNRGINYEELPTHIKRGSCIRKELLSNEVVHEKINFEEGITYWNTDKHIPLFTENREYIEGLLKTNNG